MRYLIIGLLIGAVLGFVPVWQAEPGTELYPEWYGPVADPESIERSPNGTLSTRSIPPVVLADTLSLLAADGRLISRRAFGDTLFAVSGNGAYYAAYRKIGTSVEFFAADGSPFWKTDSREYPHLSYNGKLVLLVNSDQSQARALDFHGNQAGEPVSGRFLTVIAFSKGTDIAALGFLDGSYAVMDSTGETALQRQNGRGHARKEHRRVSLGGLRGAPLREREGGLHRARFDHGRGRFGLTTLAGARRADGVDRRG
ncbi:MAG: hypothetical protein AB2L13_01400 [Spirochaetota bacterium]